jgi:CheY-like chemotaxis protein
MPEKIPWRILMVDDDDEICESTKEYLEQSPIFDGEEHPIVDFIIDFSKALENLETNRYDLLILDIRLATGLITPDEQVGIRVLDEIKRRRFIPVIFYTALPQYASDLITPLIRVVSKGEKTSVLLTEVRNIFHTLLPAVNRALIRHLETIQRDYMWGFVTENWEKFGDTPDRASLAYLLARRLAISLSGSGMKQFLEDMGAHEGLEAKDKVHPMKYYVIPPFESSPVTGDLYQEAPEKQGGYWVILTPLCDLTPHDGEVKAEQVLLGKCLLLVEQEEFKNWVAGKRSKNSQKPLESLIRNNRKDNKQPERYHFLPGVMFLPNLVVDFQSTKIVSYEQLNDSKVLKRIASLDSPFSECLLARFTRYYGRIGTPDLDMDIVVNMLKTANPIP